jgi:hypothetical protein
LINRQDRIVQWFIAIVVIIVMGVVGLLYAAAIVQVAIQKPWTSLFVAPVLLIAILIGKRIK